MTLMVLSGLNVTHASHPTTLPARKIPHQLENTLAHLWNVKNTGYHFSFTFNFFFFLFQDAGWLEKEVNDKMQERRQWRCWPQKRFIPQRW